MKKFTLILIIILFAPAGKAVAKDIDVEAHGAVLIERTTGRVLWEKNSREVLAMASTTNVMPT